ncbi:hypothetical protein QQF64_000131 [Cirrhinus molitorella]|uniref:Uncharacterized protein n=1 Tax=Cirrhinus molitorella TaxID=172907 RepID=A0ABR3NWA5_9TELE
MWQGFVPASTAAWYSLMKSLKSGAHPSHASPKRTAPVKRNSPCPACGPHRCGIFTRPVHRPRPRPPPPDMNTRLFWRYT